MMNHSGDRGNMLDANALEWLRQCYRDLDIATVEQRFGITYRQPPVPTDCPDPEGWRVSVAREWISEQRFRIVPRHRLEELAKRLILAQLEPDPDMRALYVELVHADAGIGADHFALAVQAAREAAAQYTPQARPRVRCRLLAELDELVAA